MSNISFQRIYSSDKNFIHLIADWYLSEWKIPVETTIQRLSDFPAQGIPFQVLMLSDGIPVATGGIYQHVSLLDREPRFKIYPHWLALVYTKNEIRGKGYGAMLCEKIQETAKENGLKEIALFTHTAESLYKRLGWEEIERVEFPERKIVVMKKIL